MEKKCLVCGEVFDAVRDRARFCSIACKSAFHRKGIAEDVIVSQEGVSTVSESSSIVSKVPIVSDDLDVGVPAKVLDLVKDLHLNLDKDLGITAWTADGIFIKPLITVQQVQNIARLIHAKHNRKGKFYNNPAFSGE